MLRVISMDVFDGYHNVSFKMCAMIFYMINDFSAYGNLYRYNVKGHKTCPICEEGTCYHQLQHRNKTVYLEHERFLKQDHLYCRLRKVFNGFQENENAPKAFLGEEVYKLVKDIIVIFDKTQKQATKKNLYKKRLCDLIYLQWMNTIERYMKILKGHVKNSYRPKASIVERYIAKEAVEFCANYLLKAEAIGLLKSLDEGRCVGKGTRGIIVKCYKLNCTS
ncbi:hypothetical protein L6164_026255 [Bauhinia variegata]|uniref:Uncharacterized protein n=1 Tax=Bauhinia variegata TaxID=167791 RepID=A0ACB9LR56_BAUVA|nr:hypothetical protein L6164_026255 [Bauhinia variegata]